MITLLISALRQGMTNYRTHLRHAASLAARDRQRPAARGRWKWR